MRCDVLQRMRAQRKFFINDQLHFWVFWFDIMEYELQTHNVIFNLTLSNCVIPFWWRCSWWYLCSSVTSRGSMYLKLSWNFHTRWLKFAFLEFLDRWMNGHEVLISPAQRTGEQLESREQRSGEICPQASWISGTTQFWSALLSSWLMVTASWSDDDRSDLELWNIFTIENPYSGQHSAKYSVLLFFSRWWYNKRADRCRRPIM